MSVAPPKRSRPYPHAHRAHFSTPAPPFPWTASEGGRRGAPACPQGQRTSAPSRPLAQRSACRCSRGGKPAPARAAQRSTRILPPADQGLQLASGGHAPQHARRSAAASQPCTAGCLRLRGLVEDGARRNSGAGRQASAGAACRPAWKCTRSCAPSQDPPHCTENQRGNPAGPAAAHLAIQRPPQPIRERFHCASPLVGKCASAPLQHTLWGALDKQRALAGAAG